ncbi:hypothetical protein D3C73_1582360 [compost metagenome]
MKLHIQFLLQEADQGRDGFAGVQLLVVQSAQGRTVMAKLAAVQVIQRRTGQQFDLVAMFHSPFGTKGFQQLLFKGGARE